MLTTSALRRTCALLSVLAAVGCSSGTWSYLGTWAGPDPDLASLLGSPGTTVAVRIDSIRAMAVFAHMASNANCNTTLTVAFVGNAYPDSLVLGVPLAPSLGFTTIRLRRLVQGLAVRALLRETVLTRC